MVRTCPFLALRLKLKKYEHASGSNTLAISHKENKTQKSGFSSANKSGTLIGISGVRSVREAGIRARYLPGKIACRKPFSSSRRANVSMAGVLLSMSRSRSVLSAMPSVLMVLLMLVRTLVA